MQSRHCHVKMFEWNFGLGRLLLRRSSLGMTVLAVSTFHQCHVCTNEQQKRSNTPCNDALIIMESRSVKLSGYNNNYQTIEAWCHNSVTVPGKMQELQCMGVNAYLIRVLASWLLFLYAFYIGIE